MNAVSLLLAGIGAGILLGRSGRPVGPVVLVAGRNYRLEYDAPFELGASPETPETLERQTDLRVELLPLWPYDIAFEGRRLRFSIAPLAPRTLTIGAPLSSSAAGSALILRDVVEVPAPSAGGS